MIIYFVSALLVSGVVFKLGQYAMLISLMVAASKFFMAIVTLVGSVILYRHWKGRNVWTQGVGHSQEN